MKKYYLKEITDPRCPCGKRATHDLLFAESITPHRSVGCYCKTCGKRRIDRCRKLDVDREKEKSQ